MAFLIFFRNRQYEKSKGKMAPYPIVPVEAADRRNHFWKSRNMINTGMMIIEAKAMTSPQRKGAWLKKAYIPIIRGRYVSPRVASSGHRKSPRCVRICQIATVAKTGRESGTIMCQ